MISSKIDKRYFWCTGEVFENKNNLIFKSIKDQIFYRKYFIVAHGDDVKMVINDNEISFPKREITKCSCADDYLDANTKLENVPEICVYSK